MEAVIKKKDWSLYIGSRFNRLEILDYKRERFNKKSVVKFLCKCDCGNEKWINASNVIRGISKSCGCGERKSRFGRKHAKDITNQRFGNLITIKDSGIRSQNGSAIWTCRCDCGRFIDVSSGDLNRGRITNCGCKKTHANTNDIRGIKFGKLTVVDIDRSRERTKGDKLYWLCECECGNRVSVNTSCLTSGGTVSCGCNQMSYHEQIIADHLDTMCVNYVRQKRFDGCRNVRVLPFDFYLPDLNVAIEYDGRQHYEPVNIFGGNIGLEKRKKNDSIKNKYCEDNEIELIRLPYTMSCQEIKSVLSALGTRNE